MVLARPTGWLVSVHVIELLSLVRLPARSRAKSRRYGRAYSSDERYRCQNIDTSDTGIVYPGIDIRYHTIQFRYEFFQLATRLSIARFQDLFIESY